MLTTIKLHFFALAWCDTYEQRDQDTLQQIAIALLTLSNDHLKHFRKCLKAEQHSQKSLASIVDELREQHRSTSA